MGTTALFGAEAAAAGATALAANAGLAVVGGGAVASGTVAGVSTVATATAAGAGTIATGLLSAQSALIAGALVLTPFAVVGLATLASGAVIVAGTEDSDRKCWEQIVHSNNIQCETKRELYSRHGMPLDHLVSHPEVELLQTRCDQELLVVRNKKGQYFGFYESLVIPVGQYQGLNEKHNIIVLHAIPVTVTH